MSYWCKAHEETARDFLACNDRSDLKKLLSKLKQKTLNARMKYDPAYATSPIFVTEDYEFSIDPDIITWLNLILSMVMNLKLLWHILLN